MAPKNKNMPDGWLDYDPIKNVIKDINVVPFKVPLPLKMFMQDSMRQYKWTPSDVMTRVPNLGLVIDLTYKFPCYYESGDFSEKGVAWVKIGCPGHNIPPEEKFLQFCDTVDAFRQKHPNSVVGVHCTHGINRTGYMICRYLVERCGFAANDALEMFVESRGYPVERENYKQRICESTKI